ncbi:hypothetical protein BIV25_37220 [Streptomyces sp. MUSC 14]|nr:hypothetical protein BIV25_37220 [Streptomyces sp. MUSC 14]
MKRLTLAATAAVITVLPVPHASAVPTRQPCTAHWRVTATVALRRPTADEVVATVHSPVVRYLHAGDHIISCSLAVGRDGEHAYRDCGGGSEWAVVRGPRGGQMPSACLRRA